MSQPVVFIASCLNTFLIVLIQRNLIKIGMYDMILNGGGNADLFTYSYTNLELKEN